MAAEPRSPRAPTSSVEVLRHVLRGSRAERLHAGCIPGGIRRAATSCAAWRPSLRRRRPRRRLRRHHPRANLQVREIGPDKRGADASGGYRADLARSRSGQYPQHHRQPSPTARIDPQELIDTRPLRPRRCITSSCTIANCMRLAAVQHRLRRRRPCGGAGGHQRALPSRRCKVADGFEVRGVYYRLALGSITGHHDFAHATNVDCRPAGYCSHRRGGAARVHRRGRSHRSY